MVQLKWQSPVIGKFSQQWGPSLSDCLEIQAKIQTGVANKGTWKSVSFFFVLVFAFRYHITTYMHKFC